jgi:hypothetical protein
MSRKAQEAHLVKNRGAVGRVNRGQETEGTISGRFPSPLVKNTEYYFSCRLRLQIM